MIYISVCACVLLLTSVRVCLMLVSVFAHSRAGATGWWRCSRYIISTSLLHGDREEGGSCRLPSHHLQPTEASSLFLVSSSYLSLFWFSYFLFFLYILSFTPSFLLSSDLKLLSSKHLISSTSLTPSFHRLHITSTRSNLTGN